MNNFLSIPGLKIEYHKKTTDTDARHVIFVNGIEEYEIQVCPYLIKKFWVNRNIYKEGKLYGFTEICDFKTLEGAKEFVFNLIKDKDKNNDRHERTSNNNV